MKRLTASLSAYLHHPDPLAACANQVALLVGSHLPFWPLYLLWCAGTTTLPTSLLTTLLAPAFCLVPLLMRRNALAGRALLVLVGIANTVLNCWVVGMNGGAQLFLLPCITLAAILFRRHERLWMVPLGLLPIPVWYGLRSPYFVPLRHYTGNAAAEILTLNALSVAVLMVGYGWLIGSLYARLEHHRNLDLM